jgi:peptidoglycan/xylan/chitin deacetylase (PgdA/CDA1 family)
MMGRTVRDHASMLLRRVQAGACSATGLTHRILSAKRGAAAILMYHRVLADDEPAPRDPAMFVRASTFAWQIARLKERWEIRTLGELLRNPVGPGERPCAVLTLDDAWRDNLTVAWPILERLGVRATIFLVRDLSLAGRGPEGEFMRPAEIRDLASKGIEFGAHTVTHPFLDLLSAREAEEEMRASKDAVEEWTGGPCDLFAYPAGRLNDETVEIARSMFRASVTVKRGWWTPECDWALIPRLGIHQDITRTRSLFDARLAELV